MSPVQSNCLTFVLTGMVCWTFQPGCADWIRVRKITSDSQQPQTIFFIFHFFLKHKIKRSSWSTEPLTILKTSIDRQFNFLSGVESIFYSAQNWLPGTEKTWNQSPHFLPMPIQSQCANETLGPFSSLFTTCFFDLCRLLAIFQLKVLTFSMAYFWNLPDCQKMPSNPSFSGIWRLLITWLSSQKSSRRLYDPGNYFASIAQDQERKICGAQKFSDRQHCHAVSPHGRCWCREASCSPLKCHSLIIPVSSLFP